MAGGGNKKNVDTTKLSPEEVKRLGLEGARRPLGQRAGGVLHQEGGVTVKKAGRFPAMVAGAALITGVMTFAYYQMVAPSEDKSVKKKH